jgi:DNA-binding beta-propeller fold protein YncE
VLHASLVSVLFLMAGSAWAEAPPFLTKWSSGSRGELLNPCAITVSAAGDVFVADSWYHRVQKFTRQGGHGFPWLDGADYAYTMGVAVDAGGSVFVADYGNSRVKKLTSAGSLLTQFGSVGTGNGQFRNTGGVAVDADGNVYVVDLGGHRIQKFTTSGSFIVAWGSPGSNDGQFAFTWPCAGIAVDSTGHVYVSDAGNSRIQKFTSSGAFVTKWGSAGSAVGKFSSPRGVAIDPKGRVYVVEEGNHRVQVFDANGAFVTGWGTSGPGDGQFNGPRGIAVDLDGNVYIADTGSHRIQAFDDIDPREVTTTQLVSQPNPSTFGQTVQLTATVSPPEAVGEVEFSEGAVVFGRVPLTDGQASLSVSTLLHGEHQLRAELIGGPGWWNSLSESVPHMVDLAPTATSMSGPASPTLYTQPVQFVAHVSALLPAPTIPLGTVQFMANDLPIGTPVPLVQGVATSALLESLHVGDLDIRAIYTPSDTFRFLGSVSAAAVHEVLPPNPVITRVRDVPNDQGGRVFVTWHCALDQPQMRHVTGYRVWRRVPPFEIGAIPGAEGAAEHVVLADSSGPPTYWEAIALLPAAQLVSYGFTAPTTQDSIAGSNPWTAFFIQALTADPFVSYGSAPDSGYSVDNLAPNTPGPLTVHYGPSSNALHWRSRAVADLRGFELYRGTSATFVPSAANLVTTTAETSYVDVAGSHYYKLAAVDIHGNRSRFVAVEPDRPVAALASFVRSTRESDRVELLWYSGGNSGIEATVYRRSEETDWERKGVIRADGLGYLTFEDRDIVPERRYGYRLGFTEPDSSEHFLGEAWSEPVESRFSFLGVGANPSPNGRVTLTLAVPAASSARVQLFDVAGREVAQQAVTGSQGGHWTVEFGREQRLRAGVYMIRAWSGNVALSRRVVVLN